MSDSQDLKTFNVTFETEEKYQEYKQKVVEKGGVIKVDYGSKLKGFSFVISPALVQSIFTGNLKENGIDSLDVDGVATTQTLV